jgi:hypothetical protein
MVAPAHVRRVAPAHDPAEAALRLYQGLYGCTLHPAGLLHSLAAIFNAEAEGRFTVAEIAAVVAGRARIARATAEESDAWRFEVMEALCDRLTSA